MAKKLAKRASPPQAGPVPSQSPIGLEASKETCQAAIQDLATLEAIANDDADRWVDPVRLADGIRRFLEAAERVLPTRAELKRKQ